MLSITYQMATLADEADMRISSWIKSVAIKAELLDEMSCEKLLGIEDDTFSLDGSQLHEQLVQQAMLLHVCFVCFVLVAV